MNEEIARKQLIDYINEKIELTPEEQLTVANAYHLHQVKKKDFFLIWSVSDSHILPCKVKSFANLTVLDHY